MSITHQREKGAASKPLSKWTSAGIQQSKNASKQKSKNSRQRRSDGLTAAVCVAFLGARDQRSVVFGNLVGSPVSRAAVVPASFSTELRTRKCEQKPKIAIVGAKLRQGRLQAFNLYVCVYAHVVKTSSVLFHMPRALTVSVILPDIIYYATSRAPSQRPWIKL